MKLSNNNMYGLKPHTFFNSISSFLGNNRERERLTPSHGIFSTRILGGIVAGVFLVALGLLLAACPESSGSTYTYVCANGTAADGTTTESDTQKCASCNGGFKLRNEQCVDTEYTCNNGIPAEGKPQGNVDEARCARCNDGYTPEGTTACVRAGQYFCTNGTPRSGSTGSTEAVHACESCFQGYTKRANNQCTFAVYTCSNGTPVPGGPLTGTHDVENCQSCSSGFIITAANTCNHRYICNNGTPTENTDASGDNVTQCASCTSGYLLTTNNSCTNDLDGDGVLNVTDVDDDNDGLIEIPDLTALHNMRYNLAGTSYKTSGGGSGNISGAPTSATTNCSTATGGVYLCGYELTQNLTFDKDGDGKTFEAKSGGGYTLDSGDNAVPYFVVANDGSGGWLPIADGIANAMGDVNAFTAIFEGNGYTISHMAISRNQLHIGMFGYTNTDAQIRNTGLVNALADYNGTSSTSTVGGLVGRQKNSTIIASYADATVDAGPSTTDYTGGLVGFQEQGTIIASYATGVVDDGGHGNNRTGGLVGRSEKSSLIIASYATSSVQGGEVAQNKTGGLVGQLIESTIIASYSTGNVNAGTGNNDSAGGLVGEIFKYNTVIASYATGNIDGGTGTGDDVGKLIGESKEGPSYTSTSYGFGTTRNVDTAGIDSTPPNGVNTASDLTDANAGAAWNRASDKTLGAWDFGTSSQAPALKYADYDGAGTDYSCDMFLAGKCGTLIPGQRN